VKNLFELKNARRVLVEQNVFENNWADGQSGMAIVIKSSQDACGTCTWQGTTDVTFRYNIVRNSPRGFNAQAVDCSGQACVDVHVSRVRVENNLFHNIGTFNGTGSDGWLVLLTHDLRDVTIRHNTFSGNLPNAGTAIVMDYGEGRARNLHITDNVFTSPVGYGIFYSGTKVGIESMRAMAGSSWTFARNVISVDPATSRGTHRRTGIHQPSPASRSSIRLAATTGSARRASSSSTPERHRSRRRPERAASWSRAWSFVRR
jgi:hypothetical protein